MDPKKWDQVWQEVDTTQEQEGFDNAESRDPVVLPDGKYDFVHRDSRPFTFKKDDVPSRGLTLVLEVTDAPNTDYIGQKTELTFYFNSQVDKNTKKPVIYDAGVVKGLCSKIWGSSPTDLDTACRKIGQEGIGIEWHGTVKTNKGKDGREFTNIYLNSIVGKK